MVEFTDRLGWRSGPVRIAEGFWERLWGIRSFAPDIGLLIRTRSVHTVGLRRPLGIVAVDADGVVLSSRVAQPGRFVWQPATAFYLEIPVERGLPAPQVHLWCRPIVA